MSGWRWEHERQEGFGKVALRPELKSAEDEEEHYGAALNMQMRSKSTGSPNLTFLSHMPPTAGEQQDYPRVHPRLGTG